MPPAKYRGQSNLRCYSRNVQGSNLRDKEDLIPEVKVKYEQWLQEDALECIRYKIQGLVDGKDIPYNMLNRKNLYKYAHMDIILTLEAFEVTAPVVENRGNMEGIKLRMI